MKKWTSLLFTVLLLETLGNGISDFIGKTAETVVPHKNDTISAARAAAWSEHQLEYSKGTDPSGMSASG